tara:strand:- start:386 stop:688 length:303 start_codon:yes stop_codon:yes gene_type:complete
VKILNQSKKQYEIVDYINNGISDNEISIILESLSMDIIDIIRVNDKKFKDLNLSTKDMENEKILMEKIIENPIILQRPIILKNGKGVIGRPPEKIFDLIG